MLRLGLVSITVRWRLGTNVENQLKLKISGLAVIGISQSFRGVLADQQVNTKIFIDILSIYAD